MERVYLDMCSLKRPFDDQRQPRVREKAAAVAGIVARAEAGEIALVRSPAHLVEHDANPREDRRLAAARWIDGAGIDVPMDDGVEIRARDPVALGFAPLDALHVAFAERAGARWFVTCDDQLLKLAGRLGDRIGILVVDARAAHRGRVMSRSAGMSNYEIRMEGWKALTERLGISGAIRFLMEYDPGHGDYAEERRELFRDLTLEDILARARDKSRNRRS